MIPSSTLLDVSDFFVPHRILTSPVSIHAPTWGATHIVGMWIGMVSKFQSTLPHGERPMLCRPPADFSVFQSTLPHGERHLRLARKAEAIMFQSTLPHGERPRQGVAPGSSSCFNPRSRMGSDFDDNLVDDNGKFQSTLPHGERPHSCTSHGMPLDVSIHAPAWGATHASVAKRSPTLFQSTLPHGERLLMQVNATSWNKFQSTLPHGERRSLPVLPPRP